VSQYFRSEILLRKYNSSNGNQIWERKFPILDDSGTAVTTDRNGNIYISGRTQWTEDNVTSGVNGEEIIGGYSDGFLAKYNSNGDRLWTKIFGSSDGREEVTEIKSDSSNNIYITGYTTGNFEVGYTAINRDIFLIKYNSQGNQIWSRQLGSTKSNVSQSIDLYTANEEVFGLAIDSSNKRIYLVGYTQGDLDGNVLTYSGSSSINSIDAFITRTMNIDY